MQKHGYTQDGNEREREGERDREMKDQVRESGRRMSKTGVGDGPRGRGGGGETGRGET